MNSTPGQGQVIGSSENDWIDSHCHLHYAPFEKSEVTIEAPKTVGELVSEAKACGVKSLISVCVDLDTIEPLEKISSTFDSVYHTVGVHPHEAVAVVSPPLLGLGKCIDRLAQAALHPKCRAIGEIGIDYYYKHSTPKEQIDLVRAQLDLALSLKKPVVIHSRDGEGDLFEALDYFAKKISGHPAGVIHCFTGTKDFGKKCLDLGFYISFSGILTFKNADDLRLAAKFFPLDRILVETDSPYLAPVPFRGKRGEPSMVVKTGEKLAEIKGLTVQEVALVTVKNTQALFGID